MTAVSYPLSGTNFPSGKWRQVFDGQHGIIGSDGTGTTCLDLLLSSVDNTATIKPGKLWYRGYILEVTANDAFTLAASTGSPVTYSIGAMFDPANESTGPLSLHHGLTSDVAGAIPTNGSFLSLREITRTSGQTLNLAAVVDQRRFLGPHVILMGGTLPTDATIGTRLWLNGHEYLRVRKAAFNGAEWLSLTTPPLHALTLVSTPSGSKTKTSTVLGGGTPGYREVGGKIEFEGEISRDPATNGFDPGQFILGTIADSNAWPEHTIGRSVVCEQGTYFNTVRVEVNSSGQVIVFVPNGAVSFPHWVSLGGLSYPRKVT